MMKKGDYECHWSSGNAYPWCFGAKHPVDFAENDCYTCPWFSEYWREQRLKEKQKTEDFNVGGCEVEIYKYLFEDRANMEKRLYGYKIFCGLIAGVVVDTSWENAENRIRERYKDDKKYLIYWENQKKLYNDDNEPMIEIYDLSERFEDNISDIYELTI